jgi:superfamily II DNA or RNA helicase
MDDSQTNLRAVQRKALADLAAHATEHFEHVAIVAVPGGGGTPLATPCWVYSGDTCLLLGSIEIMKTQLAMAAANSSRRFKG